ncbi:transcription antitermination factor NusB [Candidatus Latescibacterota bacterium]
MARNPDTAPAGTRLLAHTLLIRVEQGGAFADRLLSSSRMMALDRRDRAFVRELVLGVLRWRLRLDRIIDMYYTKKAGSLSSDVRTILRLGLFQLMFMDTVPEWAAVSESVALTRQVTAGGPAGLVNAILRRSIREGEPAIPADDNIERLAITYAHPQWIVRRWIDAFGAETAEAILDAGNRKHPVMIRVNTLKTTPEGSRRRWWMTRRSFLRWCRLMDFSIHRHSGRGFSPSRTRQRNWRSDSSTRSRGNGSSTSVQRRAAKQP